jgi:hypothetical protein
MLNRCVYVSASVCLDDVRTHDALRPTPLPPSEYTSHLTTLHLTTLHLTTSHCYTLCE